MSSPSKLIVPAGDRDDAEHGVADRRLARAALADQRQRLAGGDVEVDPVDRGGAPPAAAVVDPQPRGPPAAASSVDHLLVPDAARLPAGADLDQRDRAGRALVGRESQRGRNRQPTSQTAGDGTLPRIVGSVSATAARCGLAASSDRVYGWRGVR